MSFHLRPVDGPRQPLFSFSTENITEEQLLERAAPALRQIALKYVDPTRSLEQDDLAQAAAIGLIRAWRRFDPAKGRLGTHAWTYMLGEIMNLVRAARPVIGLETNEAQRAIGRDTSERWERQLELIDTRLLAARLLRTLTDREILVIVLAYYQEMPQIEIANLLQRDPTTISKTIDRALTKMKAFIAANGVKRSA